MVRIHAEGDVDTKHVVSIRWDEQCVRDMQFLHVAPLETPKLVLTSYVQESCYLRMYEVQRD